MNDLENINRKLKLNTFEMLLCVNYALIHFTFSNDWLKVKFDTAFCKLQNWYLKTPLQN